VGPRVVLDTNVLVSALGWKGSPYQVFRRCILAFSGVGYSIFVIRHSTRPPWKATVEGLRKQELAPTGSPSVFICGIRVLHLHNSPRPPFNLRGGDGPPAPCHSGERPIRVHQCSSASHDSFCVLEEHGQTRCVPGSSLRDIVSYPPSHKKVWNLVFRSFLVYQILLQQAFQCPPHHGGLGHARTC